MESCEQKELLDTFDTLIQEGNYIDSATSVAAQWIESNEWKKRNDALKLFEKLLESEQVYELVLKAAKKAVKNPNANVRVSGLQLYQEIIKSKEVNELALFDAEKALVKTAEDPKIKVSGTSLSVHKNLIKKKECSDSLVKSVQEALKTYDNNVMEQALYIALELITEKKDFGLALIVAGLMMPYDDDSVCEKGMRLFEHLFANNLGYSEAEKLFSEFIKDSGWYNSKEDCYHHGVYTYFAEFLCEELIKNKKAGGVILEGIAIALNNTKASTISDQEGIRKLWNQFIDQWQEEELLEMLRNKGEEGYAIASKLVEKGLAYDLSIKLAEEGTEHSEYFVRKSAFSLFKKLIKKGQGYDSVKKSAANTIHDSGSSEMLVVQVLIKLAEKGQGDDSVVQLTSKFMNSSDVHVRQEANRLNKMLEIND
ncbi:MAG: hypothetical protein AAGG81_01310 [Chlamydiota bacterium]